MFFERYQVLCQAFGLTPTGASAKIGFSKGSVSYWRKQYQKGIDAKPDTHTAQKMAEFFGVTVDYLLCGDKVDFIADFVNAPPQSDPTMVCDGTSLPIGSEPLFTERELEVISAYRTRPEFRETIDELLKLPADK